MRCVVRFRLLVPTLLLLLVAAPGPARPEDDGPPLLGRVAVKEAGFHRVPAGTDRPTRVTRGGRPVPVVRTEAGGDLVFLAHDLVTDHSAWAVYEIWGGDAAAPSEAPPRPAGGIPIPARATRRQAPDRVHGDLAAGRLEVYASLESPTWFLAWIPPGKGASIDLDPMRAEKDTAQRLTVEVWATRRGVVALDATWGEKALGTATVPDAAGGARFTWEVPAEAVPAEGTALVLKDVSPPAPPPPPQDVSNGRGTLWIDALTLSGPVRSTLEGELAVFDVEAGATLTLATQAASVWAVLVGPDGAFVGEPSVARPDESRVAISIGDVPPSTRLFASTAARVVTPTAAGRVDPLAVLKADVAEHLILAVPELVEPARQLAAYRSASGMPSVVVPVEYVYAIYGHGEHDPAAIRGFLLDIQRAPRSRLRYVVLAGDATLDRTDLAPFTTIPTPMARTIYNGATSADRLYVLPADGGATGGPSIGRLPFRDAAEMTRYVERVIEYETHPPADTSRRLMRFVTNEARFGPGIDYLLEKLFANVVTFNISPAYDIEVTFASVRSPYLWPPPEFNRKVIDGFNDGCLFFTYVGHGFGRGFDQLRAGGNRYPVLHVSDVDEIDCQGTPPVVFCLACTTAIFDHTQWDGIGEALLKRPDGPIAYWGATRICHPAANAVLGRAIARLMAKNPGTLRLGDILDRARDDMIQPTEKGTMRMLIDQAIRILAQGGDAERLMLEGSWMYTLLGDPALAIAFPKEDLAVVAAIDGERRVQVRVRAPLPDGTRLHLSLEVPRNRSAQAPVAVADPLAPESFPTIRQNHAGANDLALARTEVVMNDGKASWQVAVPPALPGDRLVVKAWGISADDVHQGATVLPVPAPPASED